ncbi:hypothetical protein BX661DRAFT_13555 [Kickxella alabastrina]|uniref:uncharacterized protein n=1 Tax=Kickxella alabastrina TaxID=61397 RepID=UPI00221F5008|nr:uncharacterized protein BX661DRAFT_13555 [Kickxella alabastrina]KAI7828383.1 hypothetical protein BX661DRAFT_13555 [Kickxella alabastrina]
MFEDGTLTISSNPECKFITESVRTIGCARTSILPIRLKKFMTYFSRATVFNGYGATETSFIVASCKWKEPAPSTHLSLYPDTFAMVVDEDENETDCYGEPCILGPQAMVRYLGQGTKSPFINYFYRTGDYSRVIANGTVSICDRMVDIVHTEQGPFCRQRSR